MFEEIAPNNAFSALHGGPMIVHGMGSTHLPAANHLVDSDEENVQPPFKLTISEYEEVASRFETSLK